MGLFSRNKFACLIGGKADRLIFVSKVAIPGNASARRAFGIGKVGQPSTCTAGSTEFEVVRYITQIY